MNFKIIRLFIFSIISVAFLNVSGVVLAADDPEEFEAASNFSYEIKFPDNQIGKKQGPLSLKMEAGQEQEIPLILKNHASKETTFLVKPNGARTNINGMIEYGPNDFSKDESMAYDLPDLLSVTEEVIVPAEGEVEVTLKLSMPKVAFDGIVLGGVQITTKDEDEPVPTDSMVINKFARLFGVTLRMTDTDVKPELELKKVYPGILNYISVIHLDIANVEPVKIEGLTTEVEIKHKTNELISYNSRKNNMEMAPNSLMNYYVSLDSEPMVAGDYTAHVKVYNSDNKWEWTHDFSISDKEAEKFNKENMGIVQERKFDWKIIVIGTAGGVIGLVLLFVIITRVRKKKNTTKEGNKKKRKRAR